MKDYSTTKIQTDPARPTKLAILRQHQAMKSFWQPRNLLMLATERMARLESPFQEDKASVQNRNVFVEPAGNIIHTTSADPFNTNTLMESLVADLYPYVETIRRSTAHTQERMDRFDRFAQGILDQEMYSWEWMMEMALKLSNTGMLATLVVHDPALKQQGEFPFRFDVLDSMDVYPILDNKKRPIKVTYEERILGAQLRDYQMFPGVADLLASEETPPEDTDYYNGYWQVGNNLDTTEFTLIRYYDGVYSALFLGCGEASETACQFNSVLNRYRESSRKGRYISLTKREDEEDEGVVKHNLGGMPLHITGCWPEGTGRTSLASSSDMGRIGWYPLLFGLRQNWIDQSRIRSLLYQMVQDTADPAMKVKMSNPDNYRSGDKIIPLEPGTQEDVSPVQTAHPNQELVMLLSELKEEGNKTAFAPSLYGARSGTSGIQQSNSEDAGSVRFTIVTEALGRSAAHFPTQATKTLMARGGDEAIRVSGTVKGLVEGYKVSELGGVMPIIKAKLWEKNGLDNPANVTRYITLRGKGIADIDLMRGILKVPNAAELIANSKAEALSGQPSVLAPDVEKATLEAQLVNETDLSKLRQQWQERQDEDQLKLQMSQMELDMQQLPMEIQMQHFQAAVDFIKKQGQQADQAMFGGAGADQSGPGGLPPNVTMPSPGPDAGAGLPPGMPPPPPGSIPVPPPPPGSGPMGGPGLPPPGGLMPPPGPGPMTMQGTPPGMDIQPRYAQGPGQQERIFQPAAAFSPPGGIGRPGMDSSLVGPNGLPGQLTPEEIALNRSVAPIQPLTMSSQGRKRKRGRRG